MGGELDLDAIERGQAGVPWTTIRLLIAEVRRLREWRARSLAWLRDPEKRTEVRESASDIADSLENDEHLR